jgi:hypothetical protein
LLRSQVPVGDNRAGPDETRWTPPPGDSVGTQIAWNHKIGRQAGMGLFTKPKSRATRRAEARALKRRARWDAKFAARNDARLERRRIRSAKRSADKAHKAQLKAQRDTDKTALKVAEAELKAAREGRLLSPTRIKRLLTVSRLLAPIVVPVVYRAVIAARGVLDERRAERLGVPLREVGQFSGPGARLSARIAGAEQSVRLVSEKNPKDAETKRFVAAVTEKLADLSAAVTAAENMPASQRRAAPAAISEQLDGIDADLLARLGLG